MPIHFKCHTCKRRLSVGSHKAGSDALCPSCGATIRVPTKEDIAALSAMTAGDESDPLAQTVFDAANFRFEDEPPPSTAKSARREDSVAQSIDPQFVSLSRLAIYLQGGLLACVALGCFVLGYLAGMSGGSPRPATATPAAPPLSISGKFFYQPQPGQSTPDSGAVLVLLPQQVALDELLSVAGLAPNEPTPPPDHQTLRAIQTLGGVYLRAGTNGQYSFALSKPGKYRVLRISRHAARAPGDDPTLADLDALALYFLGPEELLGDRKYTWGTLDVMEGTTLAHDFGPSGG